MSLIPLCGCFLPCEYESEGIVDHSYSRVPYVLLQTDAIDEIKKMYRKVGGG